MPMAAIAKAALGTSAMQTGGGLLNGLFGWIGQRKQRAHEQRMYEQNKQDELNFWNLENQYNTPQAQMARFKAAGLNPNLIYGQFNNQTPQLQTPSPVVSDQSKFLSESGKQIGDALGGAIPQMYNLRQQDAQTNLLQRKIVTEENNANLIAVTSGLKEIMQQSEQLKLDLGRETFDAMVEKANLAVQQAYENIQNTMQQTRTGQAQEQFIGQQQKTSKSQQQLNELDQKLIELGYNRNDTAYQRILKMFKNIIFNTD